MIDSNFETWERRLHEIAAEMDYPPTPNITAGLRQRLAAKKQLPAAAPWYANRLAWVAAAVLLVAALVLFVPQARATIFEFFQIGDIRIFPEKPAAAPTVIEPAEADPSETPLTAEPAVIPDLSIANLYGETTLADLRQELGNSVIQPDYPMGVGLPDQVFFQNEIGPMGILVWLETDSTEKAWAILYILAFDQGAFGAKFNVDSIQGTMVNGQSAYWVEGQHMLAFYDEDDHINFQSVKLVEGNTLIWTVEDVTYRLETVLSLEEAVRMAESMR